MAREDLAETTKRPLETERWGGCVDAVGVEKPVGTARGVFAHEVEPAGVEHAQHVPLVLPDGRSRPESGNGPTHCPRECVVTAISDRSKRSFDAEPIANRAIP